MAQLSSFFEANMVNGVPDRQYDATAWANYFSGFIGNGVSNSPADNLQVTAGTGLQVIVNSGIGYINGYYYNNTEPLTLNINTANATYPRITSIVIELNLNNREIACKTIDGNAQTNPTAPQLIQTPSTYQLQIATVYIPAGAINIGTITDTRPDNNVCGWVNILVPSENSINELAPILNGYFMGNNMALGGGYVQDCNTTYTSGIYTFAQDEGSKNCPPGLQYGILQVIVGNGGITYPGVGQNCNPWIWQIAYMTKGQTYIRQSIGGGAWTEWQQFATTNAPTFTGATLEETTHNNGIIWGGSIDAATINYPTLNDGGWNNGEIAGICENKGTIQGGQLHWNSFKWSTLDGPTLVGNTLLNGCMLVNEADGAIYYLDNNGKNCVEEAVDGATWFVRNSYTGENLFEYTPPQTGVGTVSLNVDIDGGTYNNPTFSGTANNNGTINGGTYSNGLIESTSILNSNVKNTSIVFGSNSESLLDIFCDTKQGFVRIARSDTWQNLIDIPLSWDAINMYVPINMNEPGGINYANTQGTNIISYGVFNDIFEVSNAITHNPLYSLTPVNSGLDTISIEANTNFMQAPNLIGGLQAMGSNVTNYNTVNFTQLVSPGITANCTVSWFLFNAPLLTGNSISGAIGVLTLTMTLDKSYYWGTNNSQYVDLSQIPASSARSMTPFEPVQVGTSEGKLYLNGNNQQLNANQAYTTQCLMWQ